MTKGSRSVRESLSCCRNEFVRHYFERKTKQEQNKLCRGNGIPPTAVTSVERFTLTTSRRQLRHWFACWPWPLTFWPWNWCALLPVGWATFVLILGFLRLFVLDLWANTCETHHVTVRLWPLTLEAVALVGTWYGSSVPYVTLCVPSLEFVGSAFPFGRYDTLSISTMVSLVTLNLALWPPNRLAS